MIFKKFIYWLFKNWILQVQYLQQSHKKGFENMEYAFVDSNGKRYFRFSNDFDLPLKRSQELQRKLLRLRSGLSDDEVMRIIAAMKKAMNGGSKPDLAFIGFLITEIERRSEILIHPDLLMDIVAITHIGEDEDPAEINIDYHKKKIKQFTQDSKEGLYDFFYKNGLSKYVPYLSDLENDWQDLVSQGRVRVEALKQMIGDYLTERN